MTPLLATKAGSNRKEFPLMPEGINEVTIVEVKDLGMQPIPDKYKTAGGPTERHKVRLKFAAADGTSIIKNYTLSLHEKSSLYKDLKSILGKDPGASYDLNQLIGVNAQAVITHDTGSDGRTWSNIVSLIKAKANQKTATTGAAVPAEEFAGGVAF